LTVKTRGLLTVLGTLVGVLVLGSSALAAGGGGLTPAERHQIDATVNSFVNHAVKRQNVGLSYDDVTPRYRLGLTRAEWAKGSLPVFPYPARGTRFGWTVQYRTGNELGIQLILQPRKGASVGAAALPTTLKLIHGRWLIDSMVPGAFFAPEGKPARVVGTNDFMPGPGNTSNTPRLDTPGVSSSYAYIPFLLFGLLALVLVSLALFGGVRYRRGHGGKLPPLPRRSRSGA
jgi:hypothetical protein